MAKIKSRIPRALWQGGQYYDCPGNNIIIARALCDQSSNIDLRLRFVVRNWVPDDYHSTHALTPHALFFGLFVNRQNGSLQSLTIVRWHTKPYMNNNDNIGWLFFGGYKNILPSMLTILPSSSTRAILLTSLAIYSCIPLKAIQYYINISLNIYL